MLTNGWTSMHVRQIISKIIFVYKQEIIYNEHVIFFNFIRFLKNLKKYFFSYFFLNTKKFTV